MNLSSVSSSLMSRMKSLSVSSAVFYLLLALSAFAPSLPCAKAAQASKLDQSVKPTPFSVCIDDSDCSKLMQGTKYACFQYICYPWKDDTHIQEQDRRKTCRRAADCDIGQDCFRHHDRRHVNKGLCFDEIHQCETKSDCPKHLNCCGGSCCEEPYFNQFKTLPCVSHMGCQGLGLGNFCCPRVNQTSICCHTDPNPRTTPPSSLTDGAYTVTTSVTTLVHSIVLGLVFAMVLH